MPSTPDRTDVATRWMRRVARIWSIVVISIALLLAVTHIVSPEPQTTDYPPIENLLPVLMLLSVLGLAVAWRWEGVGAALNIGFFLANLVLYRVIRGRAFPFGALLILSPVIVPGVLFLVCWWRTRSRGSLNGA
jgi:hypothetical protein